MAFHEDDYDYNDNVTRTAQDLSEPLLNASAAAQAGAIVGFFVGAGLCALCCWAAWRWGKGMAGLLAVFFLPLGLLMGAAVGGSIRPFRKWWRRKPRKVRSHKRRKPDAEEDES